MKKQVKQSGYASLLMIILLTALSVLIITKMISAGITDTQTTLTSEQTSHAYWFAETCVEDALEAIRLSDSYSGTNSLTFGLGDCDNNVVTGVGENRTINSTGNSGDTTQRIQVTIDQINPTINIDTWEIVSSF